MYAYCLFCVTQRCRVIAKLMEIRGVKRAFSPQIIRKQRKKGENVRKRFDLLPGYVFLYSEERLVDYTLFCGMDGVIRRVGQTEKGYELEGSDLDFAMKLLAKDGLVEGMILYRSGDEVKLQDTLFNGCEGKIIEIDYRKERAKVSFVFDQTEREIWVALEDVKHTRRPEGEARNAIIECLQE